MQNQEMSLWEALYRVIEIFKEIDSMEEKTD